MIRKPIETNNTSLTTLMEFQLPILAIILLITSIVFFISKTTKKAPLNLPPGPWKLPVIGNLHQLAGSLPHHGLRDLANKHGPIMHLKLGQLSTIVVSSPDMAKEVLKTHDVVFASRPQNLATKHLLYNSTDIAFAPHGDYWKQLRKICVSELLSAKRVESFRSLREEQVSDLIDRIGSNIGGSSVNLTNEIQSLVFGITAKAAFGDRCKDQERFIAVVKDIVSIAGGFYVADLFPSIKLLQWITEIKSQLERVHQETDVVLGNIINEHKEKGASESSCNSEDLVDVILNAQEHGDLQFPFTVDNIKAVLMDVFTAGSDTSATTIDWAMLEMLKNPGVMRKAQAEVRHVFDINGKADETVISEMKYLKLVIKETLRLHPPIPLLLPRECGKRCEINGFDIPHKARVMVNAWAIGRDPKYWIEPEKFDPERFDNNSLDYRGTNFQYIPFGAGRRICPGILYGLANVEFPLAKLLYHFDWKLPKGMNSDDLDMTEAFGISVRRKDDLYIIPIPYHSTS